MAGWATSEIVGATRYRCSRIMSAICRHRERSMSLLLLQMIDFKCCLKCYAYPKLGVLLRVGFTHDATCCATNPFSYMWVHRLPLEYQSYREYDQLFKIYGSVKLSPSSDRVQHWPHGKFAIKCRQTVSSQTKKV